jgi:syntaxin 18
MPFTDRTEDFRQFVNEKQKKIPEPKREKISRSGNDEDRQNVLGKKYVAEAYIIVRHDLLHSPTK